MTRIEQLDFLIEELSKKERIQNHGSDRWRIFRTLVNTREAEPVSTEFLTVQDEMLQSIIAEKGITNLSDLTWVKENIYLWQGDITTLKVDGIVNAANSGMLGCFVPCHGCIDNAIHTFSGVQLRLECAEKMKLQGYPEPTGRAKITNAYNLPCKYILHTVGPIVTGTLTKNHCDLLADCYYSCLSLAVENNLNSLAFCCISTGEFHFPNEKAAEIAISVIRDFLKTHSIKVVFNVFKDVDWRIYNELLK